MYVILSICDNQPWIVCKEWVVMLRAWVFTCLLKLELTL